MSATTTSTSATSLNFIGFDEMKGDGTAPVLFNRVVILPPPRETAGKWIHPAPGAATVHKTPGSNLQPVAAADR